MHADLDRHDDNDNDELNEVELGNNESLPETSPKTTDTPEVTQIGEDEEEGMLDHVFNRTQNLCCGHGKQTTENDDVEANIDPSKNAPEAPEAQDHNTERNASFEEEHALMTENLENAAMEPNELSEPHELAREASTVKECVEIQAHFDDKDDGVTITSDNGLDAGGEPGKLGFFVSEDKNGQPAGRRKLLMILLVGIVALVFIIGLSAGLAGKKNREEQSSLVTSSAVTNEGTLDAGDSNSVGTQSNNTVVEDTGVQEDEPEEVEPATSVVVPTPTTEAPVNETVAPVETPEECVDTISVDRSCYGFFRDEVLVAFDLCEAVSMDWVAVYPEGSDMSNFDYPQLQWHYTCGDQQCDMSVQQGNITMGFQIPPGKYQAYLFSNVGGDQGPPYSAIASSEPFEINVGTCE